MTGCFSVRNTIATGEAAPFPQMEVVTPSVKLRLGYFNLDLSLVALNIEQVFLICQRAVIRQP
ncbi:MAG: hypothetical protein AABY73_04465 [Pseudomonadota bacterium]